MNWANPKSQMYSTCFSGFSRVFAIDRRQTSNSGYLKQSCSDDGTGCPLYAYKDSNDHGEGMYMLEQSRKPSERDVLWVKRNYP
jgi:hypothetical protein